jgi:ribosomal protein L40E
MTEFLKPKFSVAVSGEKYRKGWVKTFKDRICFECEHTWKAKNENDTESCQKCGATGQPLS